MYTLSTTCDSQMRQRTGCGGQPNEHLVPVAELDGVPDALPLGRRVEGRQTRSPPQALRSGPVPRYRDVRQDEEVAGVASRDEAQAACVRGVGAVHLVLRQVAVRVSVAREVLPEVRPVRHGAVPRAACKLLGQRGVVVEGEQ